MKLTQEEKLVIESLRNTSGVTTQEVIDVLKSLMYVAVMNYSENEDVLIPYFGTFRIKYKGDDIITNQGRVAKLDAEYIPSDEMKLNIGMLEDVKRMDGDICDVPIIRDNIRKSSIKLSSIVNNNENNNNDDFSE